MSVDIKVNLDFKEKILEEIAQRLNNKVSEVYAEVVPLTPVSKSIRARTAKNSLVKSGKARIRKGHTGGHLRKGWGIIPAKVNDDSVVAFLYNNVHYAGHVNFGHRTRQGKGTGKNYEPKRNGKEYVEGQHFLEKALEAVGLDPSKINENYKG